MPRCPRMPEIVNRKSVIPAFSNAVIQPLFDSCQRIGSPRKVKQYCGCLPRCSSNTVTASRLSGTPLGVPFLVWFNHAVLRSGSTRFHSKLAISFARHPVASAKRTKAATWGGQPMKHEPVCLNTWKCFTTVSDVTQPSTMWLRWTSRHQQSPDRTVHRSWVRSLPTQSRHKVRR